MTDIATLPRENQSLRRTLRDLVAISSLTEFWLHRTSEEIAAGLAGILVNTLQLDLAYICFRTELAESEIESGRSRAGILLPDQLNEIRDGIGPFLAASLSESRFTLTDPSSGERLQALLLPIGTTGSQGHVLAASRERGFPDEHTHLLLRVAVNQATVTLRQKQIEEELRKKQSDLTDFFENATEGLHWVGPDGIIIWANQAELDLLGYSRDEYIGHHFSEFYVDQVLAEDVLDRLVSNQPVQNYEVRLRRKDGSIRHVVINSSVYREHGDFVHTRCFTRDITERKRMEDELRRAYDDLELRVQHRTRELSAAIDALRDEIAVRKQVEVEVNELRGRLAESREAERLFLAQELHDGPIQDLFALSYELSELPSDASIPNVEAVREAISRISRTLRNISEELRPSALIASGLEEAIRTHLEQFRKQHPKFDIHVHLDSDRLTLPERNRLALFRIYQQALANVVRHAQANRIEISLRTDEERAILEVRDDGRGFTVPENWIDFARQGHLGLIGSVERAETVGGQLIVHSTPGQGTRIEAQVPLVEKNIQVQERGTSAQARDVASS